MTKTKLLTEKDIMSINKTKETDMELFGVLKDDTRLDELTGKNVSGDIASELRKSAWQRGRGTDRYYTRK